MTDPPRYLADMSPLEAAYVEAVHDVGCDETPPHGAADHEPFEVDEGSILFKDVQAALARQGIRLAPITQRADETRDHEQLFETQWARMREATKAWQAAHPGNDLVWPDLGELLTWLLNRDIPMPTSLDGTGWKPGPIDDAGVVEAYKRGWLVPRSEQKAT